MMLQWLGAIFGLAILFGPADVLRRVGRLPGGWISSLLIGHCLLFTSALAIQLAGVPLTAWTVAGLPVFAGLVGSIVLMRRRSLIGIEAPPASQSVSPYRWVMWAGAAIVVVFVARLSNRPLQGADVMWRWEHLARLILSRRELGFYPPHSAADFEVYLYPESFPPLVSLMYWWIYAWARTPIHDWPVGWPLTTLAVTLQYAACLTAAYRLGSLVARSRGEHLASDDPLVRDLTCTGGAMAMLLMAATPLVNRSVAIGQETGLTTLVVLAMAVMAFETTPRNWIRPAIMAGVAAAVGALAREYGPTYVLCIAPVVGWRARNFKAALVCAAVCASLALPWYIRTWVLCGNPLFSHRFFGLPVNALHVAIMDAYAKFLGWSDHSLATLFGTAPSLMFEGLVSITIGVIGTVAIARRHAWIVLWLVVLAGLWAVSVPQTSAGYYIALRVASPALALLAVIGGAVVLAPLVVSSGPPSQRALVFAGLSFALAWSMLLLVAYPFPPSLLLKVPPSVWVWRELPLTNWARIKDPQLTNLPAGTVFATDDAYQQAAVHALQWPVTAVPYWSPRVAAIFTSNSEADVMKSLTDVGVDALWLDPTSPNSYGLAQYSPLLRQGFQQMRDHRGMPTFYILKGPGEAGSGPATRPSSTPP